MRHLVPLQQDSKESAEYWQGEQGTVLQLSKLEGRILLVQEETCDVSPLLGAAVPRDDVLQRGREHILIIEIDELPNQRLLLRRSLMSSFSILVTSHTSFE